MTEKQSNMNQNYEKLGLFYLGKHYDSENQKIEQNLLLYKSKHLVTHGICMGMTGSGKTGLCVSILEEAAIDNVPVIIVDPKGDLTNLLLTFPNLSKEEFLPWVSTDEASKKGISVEQLAENQAELWKNGLADWGQSPERIKMFMDSAVGAGERLNGDVLPGPPGGNRGTDARRHRAGHLRVDRRRVGHLRVDRRGRAGGVPPLRHRGSARVGAAPSRFVPP